MVACRENDELLTLHAAGALEPEEEARVRAHLDACAACRAEVEAHREVLGLAALPPPSAREQAVLAALPRTTADAWLSRRFRQATQLWTAGAFLAAAAVVLLVMGPVVRYQPAPRSPPSPLVESPPPPQEETPSSLEQWALSDPLAEALELADEDLESAEEGAEPSEAELEELLSYPNPGESL